MTRKIAYTNKDTGRVMFESMGSHTSDQEYLDRFPGSFILETNDIPDSEFSGAWILSKTGKITTDMKKAREILKENIRNQRKELFIKLDGEFIEALSKDEDLTKIKLKQKNIRDMTDNPEIEKSMNVKDLKKTSKLLRLDFMIDTDKP
jgi:hypothetical protein